MNRSYIQTWTRGPDRGWTPWSHPELALEAVARGAPAVAALLLVGDGPREAERLLATVRLARRLSPGRLDVVAGTPHPSASWVESVRAAGADVALLVSPLKASRALPEPWLDGSAELGDSICPELHATFDQGVALSVCGRQRDRMVLARHHLDRWCLAAGRGCPHLCGVAAG